MVMAKFKLVLIIDDSDMDSFVTKTVMERLKLSDAVVTVTNAYNALEYIRSLKKKVENEEYTVADLCVFLDIMMPYMNAGDFLNALDKTWPSLVERVYIVSGLPLEEQSDIVLRKDVGGFITKPLTDDKARDIFLRKELE